MKSQEFIDKLAELYRQREALENFEVAAQYQEAIAALKDEVKQEIRLTVKKMLEAEDMTDFKARLKASLAVNEQ